MIVAMTGAAMLFVACTDPVEPPPRDSDRPLQTEQLEYELRETDAGLVVTIPFTYTNETGETVSVVNCNGIAPPALEKRVGGDWVHAWSAIVPLCLSPPITIAPGDVHTDTLRVLAARPSNDNAFPRFEVEEIDGIYRLVWHNVVHDYDPDREDFGDPLPLEGRISNSFALTVD